MSVEYMGSYIEKLKELKEEVLEDHLGYGISDVLPFINSIEELIAKSKVAYQNANAFSEILDDLNNLESSLNFDSIVSDMEYLKEDMEENFDFLFDHVKQEYITMLNSVKSLERDYKTFVNKLNSIITKYLNK